MGMNKIKEFVIDTLDRNRLTKSIIVFCYEFYIWVIKRPMLANIGIDFAGVEVPVVVNKKFNISGHWIADMEIIETRPLWYSYNGKKEKTTIPILANKEIGFFTRYEPKWFSFFSKNKFIKLLRSK